MNEVRMVPFKDEDCERFMEQEVKPWIEENVTDFAFDSYDGKKLQAYCAIPEKPKKALVFVHGFCEFFGKYHELFYDFYHAGYAVFFYEQRGFGKSLREVSDKDAVYVGNFTEYVEDLKLFTDEVSKMTEKKLDLMLFAHSMGGCVGALYLEKYPETFKKAVLSSPMMRMALEPRLKKVARPLCLVQKALHRAKRLAIGQERFDERPDFKNSCALSEARYSYQFKQRLKNAEYQTNGATYAWVLAALNAEKKLMQNAGRIKCPVLLCSSENDTMVDVAGQTEFAEKSKVVKLKQFPEAKHELFNCSAEILEEYYATLLKFYE